MSDAVIAEDVLAGVAAGGASDAGGVPVVLLGDFLTALAEAVTAGAPITAARLRRYRQQGERAARDGVPLRALLDLYLSAAWRLWPHLPPVVDGRSDPSGVVVAGQVMLHAVDDVVAVLTEAYQLARQSVVRAEESARREFIDDLLTGTSDVIGLTIRASSFGLDLSGPHAVAVVQAERGFVDGSPLIAALERSVRGIHGDTEALVSSKEGRLTLVFAAPDQAAVSTALGHLTTTLHRANKGPAAIGRWQVGLGRTGPGAVGVVASYRDAQQALTLARRLDIPGEVVDLRDLLVYQVLLRDQDALTDLVQDTFSGLAVARGGAQPLIDTLAAYFAAGGNSSAAARSLHLSVRAVTYRLDRVRELIGRDPDLPEDRFMLQVATQGARLLGWPTADSSS